MNNLKKYIIEKLVVGNNLNNEYKYYPKDKNELIECIKEKIKSDGYGTKNNPLDLNDIDTSKITDMSKLFDCFDCIDIELKFLSENGYFNISDWDVSNVENMKWMFFGSKFNGDISDWDVSNVKDMSDAFCGSPLQKNLPNWYKEWYEK